MHEIDKKINEVDLFCIIKLADPEFFNYIKKRGKKVVYDILDCWAQPKHDIALNSLNRTRQFFIDRLGEIKLDGVIFSNKLMHEDFSYLVSNSTYIYHHYWPILKPIQIREIATTVAYVGDVRFLGNWQHILRRMCESLGMKFIALPGYTDNIDICVAVRGEPYNSIVAQRYKSNVKLANCYGAGIPCTMDYEQASYRETAIGSVLLFKDKDNLYHDLEQLKDYNYRRAIQESFLAHRHNYSVETIAKQYENYFQGVLNAS